MLKQKIYKGVLLSLTSFFLISCSADKVESEVCLNPPPDNCKDGQGVCHCFKYLDAKSLPSGMGAIGFSVDWSNVGKKSDKKLKTKDEKAPSNTEGSETYLIVEVK